MSVPFPRGEFDARMARLKEVMAADRMDAMLLFAPESLYWLTGYDSAGYTFFQCLTVTSSGRMVLLTRAPDLRQARHTSILDEILVWADRADADPVKALKEQLFEMDLLGARIGVETDTIGLSAKAGRTLDDELRSFGTLLEASDVVPRLRAIKTPAEIAYLREAAAMADDAWRAGVAAIAPGARESAVRSAITASILSAGGELPSAGVTVGSGRDALLVRGRAGDRELATNDQVMLNFAGSKARYHATLTDVVVLGEPRPRHRDMFDAVEAAFSAIVAAMRPGNTFGAVYDAHAQVMRDRGMGKNRLNACGASMGAIFAPTWSSPPMFYHGNPAIIVPDMVLFAHAVLLDSEHDTAMSVGRTFLTHDGEAEPLSALPVKFIRK